MTDPYGGRKPGLSPTARGCLPFIAWGVVGAGIWATAIGLGIAVARRIMGQ